jgi:hypothetical protein
MKCRKQLLLALALCLFAGLEAGAQSIKAMLEQITALKAYIVTAEKGYQIAEDGLHAIRDIKHVEFDLHSVYFGSLAVVNPAVRNMPQVGAIVRLVKWGPGDIDALLALINDGELKMDDGERMRAIEAIDKDIQERYRIVLAFTIK